jgi:hypothetical protein
MKRRVLGWEDRLAAQMKVQRNLQSGGQRHSEATGDAPNELKCAAAD